MARIAIEPIQRRPSMTSDAKHVQLSDKAAGLLSRLLDALRDECTTTGRRRGACSSAVDHYGSKQEPAESPTNWFPCMKVPRRMRSPCYRRWRPFDGSPPPRKRRKNWIASRNKNFGVADQHAFVRVLGEGWFIVTGEKPSTKKSRRRDIRFLDLLHAAWKDAGHSTRDRNFKPSIDKARQLLSSPSPEGPPETRADFLTRVGPEWGLPEWTDFQTPKR